MQPQQVTHGPDQVLCRLGSPSHEHLLVSSSGLPNLLSRHATVNLQIAKVCLPAINRSHGWPAPSVEGLIVAP
jgi:hypothetical protein